VNFKAQLNLIKFVWIMIEEDVVEVMSKELARDTVPRIEL